MYWHIALLLSIFICLPVSADLFGGEGSGLVVRDGATCAIASSLNLGTRSLEVQPGGIVTGTFVFGGGTLQAVGGKMRLTGIYDATLNKITLGGGGLLTAESGRMNIPIFVSSTNNKINGQFLAGHPLRLVDADSVLDIDVTGGEFGTIFLNGGQVNVLSEINFLQGGFFTGPGIVNGSTYELILGSGEVPATTALQFKGSPMISLLNTLVLGNTWGIYNTMRINGGGQILDVTDGTLAVLAGAQLHLNDCILYGMKPTSITVADDDGIIKLQNIIWDFDENVTFNKGTIRVVGETTFMLRSKSLTLSGTSELIVDGATLWFESTDHGFFDANVAHITLLNGGAVRDLRETAIPEALGFTGDTTLGKNYAADPLNPLSLSGTGIVTLDSGGHSIEFAQITGNQLIVGAGVDAIIKKTVLKKLPMGSISLGAGASLTFGDKSVIEMGDNQTLNRRLSFIDAAVLDGKGYCLTLGSSGALEVQANGVLTLRNITIRGVSASKISTIAASGVVVFENVVLELSDDFAFGLGSFQVSKRLFVTGGKVFACTSDQANTILTKSSLIVDASTFSYAPAAGGTNKLVFTDSTSWLVLADSTLQVASSGAVFKKGVILIQDAGTLASLATAIEGAVVLGDGASSANDCTVRITPQSVFHLADGILKVDDAGVV